MLCPSCGHDNIAGVDTCDACGTPLVDLDFSDSQFEQAITGETVKVLNPPTPFTVRSAVTVREAVDELVERRIGSLLVEEDGVLVGVFTERDVLNKISSDPATFQRPISEFMTQSPATITKEDSIAYALHTMDLGGHRHLPVVDAAGLPIGIISLRDILHYLCERFAALRPA